jgi:O-acetyl-ADP-ribose deacetylase (regulator of RNase III)
MMKGESIFRRIRLVQGNIALLEVEAVVNAANISLQLGGGVAGAIRRAGGRSIQEECDRLSPIKVGQAVLTGAGNLKARYVIHAVGPVYGQGNEDVLFAAATRRALDLARGQMLSTVAFPAIAAGIFGFPLKRCSEVMLKEVLGFLRSEEFPRVVTFCLFDDEAMSAFSETFASLSADEG